MKVFISVDMEGISGLVRWADVATQGMDYQRNRSLLTCDANAAIEGAFEAGAAEVVVEENHGVEDLCNVVVESYARRVFHFQSNSRGGPLRRENWSDHSGEDIS